MNSQSDIAWMNYFLKFGDVNFVDCFLTFKELIFSVLFSVGVLLFNLCIVIYLYGDLAIYAAAVPKSIRDVAWYVQDFCLYCKSSNGHMN